jgi:adenylate cyclase
VRRDLALADLRASFGRYLPAKLVAAALERNDFTDGEERQISVLFADLRGFTGYCASRRGKPAAIMQALNAKFAAAQVILDRHEGTLDKFDGDAVIAFWNGVGEQPDHAARALAAAIEIIEGDVDGDNENGELRFKAAVATGLAFVGSYGSKQKMNFSAIGEPMNLAARLEGLCNEYGVSLVVSESTIEAVRQQASKRPDIREVLDRNEIFRIGSTQLKGYSEEFAVMSVRRKSRAD